MSGFSLIVLVGMSFSCETFEVPKFLISLITFSFVTWLKVNTGLLLFFRFIVKILGCLRYFDIAFKIGSFTFSIIESDRLFWGIF